MSPAPQEPAQAPEAPKSAPKKVEPERTHEASEVKRLTVTLPEGLHTRLYDYLLSTDGLAQTAGSPSTFVEKLLEERLDELEQRNGAPFQRVLNSLRKKRQ